ncbi:hypothetical protein H6S82_13500 [Planktothrix sp. FACHB-1355]|uniref:REase AHJR-like domain-containing protein n=1 Tax=Aerosakkonema funiforme FACHB-1375 TaxID=2949571 RepID=A0A926VG92_9CYAN|nr:MULTISPECIES: hypothetical protein [Oscillatoriales]MBD2183286.1 hypothetical protein [Aerosakkonema funiforme FACHB-1375]MBD3559869.1 hypothetical protein [Planktothrix sp. FACHB-1355]
MNKQLETLAVKTIAEISDNYRQQGYQVLIKSRGINLDEFLYNENIDFIVHAEQGAVIVALKPCLNGSNNQRYREQIAHLYDYPVRDSYDIKFYLARALEIIEMGGFDSAICSGVFIAEAVMRMVAEQHSIDFEIQEPTTLAQTFFAYGLISQEDYEVLVKAIELRDRMMYKREQMTVDRNFASQTVEVVQRLFKQAGEEGI